MNGRRTYTDAFSTSRRRFLKQAASLFAVPIAAPFFSECADNDPYSHITGGIVGANHKTGHLLRQGKFPATSKTINTDVLIVGGGISGLSAMRWLKQQGVDNVLLLEMDNTVGGNSISGRNAVSAYPWAAHYLPIPDVANAELISFLRSAGVIKSFDENGLPVYNEYHLCHDPEERLYINGHWQEGLIPQFGVGKEDREQIGRFMASVEEMKTTTGSDGRPCFAIPVDSSSADEQYRKLDSISFKKYLDDNGYNSKYLRWYLEYCCKDDYGSILAQTSAWAGLHYFASRRGKAANAASSAVLTWPEGNAFLMNHLRVQAGDGIYTNMLAHAIKRVEKGIEAQCYDTEHKTGITIAAKKVLLCTPQYITRHILPRARPVPTPSYAPWMVANITLHSIPHTKGVPLSWDNVVYGREYVGYVYANHQDLATPKKGVITFYLPITDDNPITARNRIHNSTYEQWRKLVVDELIYAHPDIAREIAHIDVWVWGHGMVRPGPGYIWGQERQAAMQPIDDAIFFAHTDLSGISIFEEGFYQGINAAKRMLRTI